MDKAYKLPMKTRLVIRLVTLCALLLLCLLVRLGVNRYQRWQADCAHQARKEQIEQLLADVPEELRGSVEMALENALWDDQEANMWRLILSRTEDDTSPYLNDDGTVTDDFIRQAAMASYVLNQFNSSK